MFSQLTSFFSTPKKDDQRLITAILNNDLKQVETLITKQNVNVDTIAERSFEHIFHDFSALSCATELNHGEIALFLIEQKANVNSQDRFGMTPLNVALLSKNLRLIRSLIENEGIATTSDYPSLKKYPSLKPVLEFILEQSKVKETFDNPEFFNVMTAFYLRQEKLRETASVYRLSDKEWESFCWLYMNHPIYLAQVSYNQYIVDGLLKDTLRPLEVMNIIGEYAGPELFALQEKDENIVPGLHIRHR